MLNNIVPLNIKQHGFHSHLSEVNGQPLNLGQDSYLYARFALDHYSGALHQSDAALKWLSGRNILLTLHELERLSIGYSDKTLGQNFLRSDGWKSDYARAELKRLGLISFSGFESLLGCVVFPFFDIDGNIVGAYGRRISSENRRKDKYHHQWKIGRDTFFNVKTLIENKHVILTKTPVEACTLISAGIDNVISTMGLYDFEIDHILDLLRLNVKEVTLAYDNSDPGNQVSNMVSQTLEAYDIQVTRIALPRNRDVNAYSSEVIDISETYRHLIANRFPVSQTFENLIGG